MRSAPLAQPPGSSRAALARLTRNSQLRSCSEAVGREGLAGSSVVTKAKGSQKNEGLYFDYEPVDPEVHKQMPIEKEKIREEFAWVRQARNPQEAPVSTPRRASAPPRRRTPPKSAATGTATPPAASKPLKPANRSPAGLKAATEVAAAPPPAIAEPATAAQQANALQAAEQRAMGSSAVVQEPITATEPAQAAAAVKQQVTPALASTGAGTLHPSLTSEHEKAQVFQALSQQVTQQTSAGKEQEMAGPAISRKSALLARLNRPAVQPNPQPQSSSSQTAASSGDKPMVTAAATAAASTAAVAAVTAAATVPALETGAQELQLEGLTFELPALPTAASEEEREALAVLQEFCLLDADEARALQGLDLATVSAQDASEQEQFASWMGQLKQRQQQQKAAASGQQQQQQPELAGGGNQSEEDSADDAEQLAAAAAVESEVSALLAQGGRELEAFRQLLGSLGPETGSDEQDAAGIEDDMADAAMSEEQVLAQLRESNPELYALLGPGNGLQYGPEEEELEAALDSLQRLGLAGGEESDSTDQAEAAMGMADDSEEEMSDAELAELARHDPDLAALLGSNSLGQNFERMLEPEGLDEGEEDGPVNGEEAELADLFDAIDEDPDLDDADRSRAKFELQSMFNLGGMQPERPPAALRPAPARGLTTTGRQQAAAGPGGEPVVPDLLAKPRPRP